jgi:glycolate oxidase FAD binding subunit
LACRALAAPVTVDRAARTVEVIWSTGARARNFVPSLGLITEVTLRTSPQPPERRGLLLQGELGPLDELRRWLLSSSLTPELIDWWSPAVATQAGADPQHALLLGLASVSDAALRAQCLEIRTRGEQLGLRGQPLDPERLEALRAVALGRPEPGGWLLRFGTLPSQTSALLAERVLRDLPVVLGAGSGLGDGWAGSELPAYRVEELRRSCVARGGVLTVLQQPPGGHVPAWDDVPSKPMIEAVKAQFDPKQQLARGRLPGVRDPLNP